MKRIRIVVLAAVVLTAVLTILAGCGGDSTQLLGKEIPADTERVTLEQVLAGPQKYNGKNVVLTGFVSGQCGSLCHFTYKEGAEGVSIWPQGYKLPKLTTGAPVTAYANVTVGPESVVFTALGLRIGKGKS